MNEAKNLSDDELLKRRYARVNKTRKEWICNRCGAHVEKGGQIEHSYSADMKVCIELCVNCVELLKKRTIAVSEPAN